MPKDPNAAKNAEKRSGLKIKKPAAGAVSDKPWGKSYEKFDPDGPGYDEETADELRRLDPLTMPKPTRPPKDPSKGASRANEGAFESWQWHPEAGDWKRHGGSRDRRTGQGLKGRAHTSFGKYLKGEKAAGYTITKDPKTGRYYSHPKQQGDANKGKAAKRSGLKIVKKKRVNKTPKE